MAKRWKREDVTYLRRYASKRTLKELAERFKTDEETVEAQLVQLGLAAQGSDRARYVEDPAVESLEKGVKALRAGKDDEARKHLEAAVESDLAEVVGKARLYLRRLELPATERQADDPYLRAVYDRNQGDYDSVVSAAKWGGRWDKEGRFALLGAAALAAQGDLDAAKERLDVALVLSPDSLAQARYDPDLAPLLQTDEPA